MKELTDVVYSSCTEFPKELLGTKGLEVMDYKWPQMENVVSGEAVTFFDDDCLASEQGHLDGQP